MATIDLTDGQSGAGVVGRQAFYIMEKTLDWAEALDQASATVISSGDIFQVLDLAAEHMLALPRPPTSPTCLGTRLPTPSTLRSLLSLVSSMLARCVCTHL